MYDGANDYFERLVRSKFLMNEASINKYLQDKHPRGPKVVWQRQQDMPQYEAKSNNTTTAINDAQVIVTVQGFPYLNSDGLKQKLDIVTLSWSHCSRTA